MPKPLRAFPLPLALLGALLHCAPRHAQPQTPRESNAGLTLSPSTRGFVTVEPAATAPETTRRSYAGRVAFDERRVARLGSPVNGRVTRVGVVEGDTVRRDEALVSIHSQALAAASAQAAQAHAARLLALRQTERAERLAHEGAGSLAELQQTRTQLALARLEETRANASLAALGGGRGAGSDDYRLRTPMQGTVVERHVAPGAEVRTDQAQPLLVVADLSRVWVLAEVYEDDLATVRPGSEAAVELTALGDQPARSGRVTDVSRSLSLTTRTATARVELDNPDGLLRPGMTARVQIDERTPPLALVPTSAVLARRDEYFVFVRAPDGSFLERRVRLGERTGDHVAIREGVAPGDLVITQGAILLDAEANAL